MPEISEEELQSLQQAKTEREALAADKTKLEAEKAEAAQRAQAAEQQRQQLEQHAAMLAAEVQRRPAPVQPPQEEATDFLALDPRNYKKEIVEQVGQGVNQVVQEYWKTQRQTAREIARMDPEVKSFMEHAQYGKEIEAMLDAQPPNLVLTPAVYKTAVEAIKGKYFNQLRDEAVRAATAPPPTEEGEEGEPYQEEQATAPARRTSAPPMPVSSRAHGTPSTSPKRKFKPLSPEEKEVAARFGMADEEYDRYSHDLTVDVMGFRKDGKMRSRV